jgi:UDP-glucose 4-epimerase
MRVLVTGASGYVGSAVLAALSQAGHEPVALVRTPWAVDVEAHVGDLLAPESLSAPLGGVDAVCHLAGLTRARESWTRPAEFFQANAVGTANLLTAFLSVCPAGCYKHFVNGKWFCCQCGDGA